MPQFRYDISPVAAGWQVACNGTSGPAYFDRDSVVRDTRHRSGAVEGPPPSRAAALRDRWNRQGTSTESCQAVRQLTNRPRRSQVLPRCAPIHQGRPVTDLRWRR